MRGNWIQWLGLLLCAVMAAGCGKSRGSQAMINGVASKGPIGNGTVTVYALEADGTQGSVLGTATTQADGTYSIALGSYNGNVLVTVSGGSYTDEATATTVSNSVVYRAAVPNVSGNISAAVTPLTELAVQNAGTLSAANITASNHLVSALSGGVDIITTMPANTVDSSSAAASTQQKDYGVALAAISQMSKNTGSTVSQLITQLKNDLTDRQLDSTGATLSSALSDFLSSSNNRSGVSAAATQVATAITSATTAPITVQTPVDSTPPTVTYTTPVTGSTGVATTSAITATFSENMNSATLTADTFTITNGTQQVAGTVTCSGTTATFTPSSNLSYNTTYTATVTTGARDAAGNGMAAAYTWTFTTGSAPDTTRPTVVTVSPYNNSTSVAVTGAVTVTFSEAMTPSTINTTTFTLADGAGNAKVGTITYSGNSATFTPLTNLSAGTTYTATVTTGVKDASDNALAANYSWSFTTAPATAPPVLPAAPTGVTATAGNGSVVLTWNSVTGATGYNVYRGLSASLTKTNGSKTTNVSSPHTVSSLTNGTQYYFFVTATDSSGESTESTVVTATPAAPSTPGIAWTERATTPASTEAFRAVTWAAGKFIAVGSNVVATSTDGATWTRQSSIGSSFSFNGIASSGSIIVAVGGSSNGQIYTSTDGVSWTQRTSPSTAILNAVIWAGTKFVAVGNSSTVLTSTDGITWTKETTPTSTMPLQSVAWSGSKFLAGGYNLLLSSSDGSAWTSHTVAPSPYFSNIYWTGTEFLANNWNSLATSTDGITWSTRTSGAYNSIVRTETLFAAALGNGDIATSTDGVTWTVRTTAAYGMTGIAWSGSKFVAVGYGGLIYSSE